MKTLWRILKWTGIVLVTVVLLFVLFVQFTWDKKFEAPFPENIKASTDSAVIARGKYLAYGPAHCATCHVPMDKIREVEEGLEIPLSGGWELTIPPGTFRAPNLTPDMETGIGKRTDAELARILRYMVYPDGRCVMPFMPFAEMSDYDLTAVISFLRSQPAVKHEMKRTEYTFMGKAVMALGLIKPEGTKGTPPATVAIDSTAEYGKYVANYIANCYGCHTNRDLNTGAFIGEPFAGGLLFTDDPLSEGYSFVAPNLTPDPSTGVMAEWSEQAFVNRFKSGRVHKGSPMPWGAFSRMNDVELKAIYRYLKTLTPVKNKVEKTVFPPGETLPS